jgi:hypothetical protein
MNSTFKVILPLGMLIFASCRDAKELPTGGAGWELSPPAEGAKPVEASGKLEGIYPVGSRIEDRKAAGGFGPCSNLPKNLGDKGWGLAGAVSIVAFPDEPVAYFKHLGIALRVINRTDKTVAFRACDSALSIVPEALATDGKWCEIETLPQAICGNSFHHVFLEPNQYWEFPARTYDGRTNTKIRFRLDPGEDQPAIYSNEYGGKIAKGQLN